MQNNFLTKLLFVWKENKKPILGEWSRIASTHISKNQVIKSSMVEHKNNEGCSLIVADWKDAYPDWLEASIIQVQVPQEFTQPSWLTLVCTSCCNGNDARFVHYIHVNKNHNLLRLQLPPKL